MRGLTDVRKLALFSFSAFLLVFSAWPSGSGRPSAQSLDEKVRSFLDRHRYAWRDMNVPESDGKILYSIVIDNKYTRALEIGTSTGHSAIWIAWALSKTGGRLTTIEIDARRHREAVTNFKEAGLSEYIDARLADAHELVEQLEGPCDFVSIDADKEWYVNYARAVIPKLELGGCIAAHNVHASRAGGRRWRMGGDYYEFMMDQPDFETFIHPDSWSGLAISFKKK